MASFSAEGFSARKRIKRARPQSSLNGVNGNASPIAHFQLRWETNYEQAT